jgi:hypothetical protein
MVFFMDHASQEYKIAADTAPWIGPAVRSVAPLALRWEEFLREVDAGGSRAASALYGEHAGPTPRVSIVAGRTRIGPH